MGIIVKNALIKAYHFINMIERYYRLLRSVYSIFRTRILAIKLKLAFQMASKAINNLVIPNMLVFTLLVFGTYPRIIELNLPSLFIFQPAITMKKAIDEDQKYIASQ